MYAMYMCICLVRRTYSNILSYLLHYRQRQRWWTSGMGRVRRYKKIKSCDPFAKKKARNGSTEVSKHDEPPAMFVERRNKAENMKTKGLTGEDLDELMLQREALRELAQKREHGQDASGKRKQKRLEGKKEGESMKAFKKRIRQETRRTLHEELSNISSTSLKRKEKLKERKQKRKEMKQTF